MKTLGIVAISGVLLTTIITSIVTKKPSRVYTKINAWKKERIRNAFYDTITQKDIAWG